MNTLTSISHRFDLPNRLIALLFVTTLAPAAIEKLLAPSTPTWFIDQFSSTFLSQMPGGLPLSFYGIAILEALSAGLIAAALITSQKILRSRSFYVGLILAEILFIALAFGQRLTHKFDQAALLFFYAFLTFLLLRLAENPLKGNQE